MCNNVYVLYNTLSKRYGDVFATASDGMAEKNTRLAMQHAGNDLNDFELCRVGKIEIESGNITTEPIVRIAWNVENNMPLRQTEDAKVN